jgi:Flp pilus assembly protein TadG
MYIFKFKKIRECLTPTQFRGILDRIRSFPGSTGEDGQSLVEFAMTLPIFLMVITGIFTFGIALNNYILLTNATNVGALQLAISRQQTTDPCATAVTAIVNAAPMLTSANLTYAFSLNGVSYSGKTCSSTSTTTGAAGNLVQGAPATVSVSYPCHLAAYNWTLGKTCTFQASVTEMIQ